MSKQQHNKDKHPQPKSSQTYRALAYFSQIGVTIVAAVLVGVFLGKFLDSLLGTKPWLLLIFSLLGAGAAIRVLFNTDKKW